MTPSEAILENPVRRKHELIAELTRQISSAAIIRRDEPLARHTTLRIGGPADAYVEPASEHDLAGVLKYCGRQQWPCFVIGRGSNLLVRDGGFRGVCISLAHPSFSRIEIIGSRLHCGAGAKLKNVAVEAKRQSLSGVEFLEGIPGSVGGALRMNAGAMGQAIFEVVASVRLMDRDGNVREVLPRELTVEYRGCRTLQSHVAIGAVLQGVSAARETIEARMKAFSRKRWDSQPAAPSAGCLFKNPPGIPAGKLIDELGLKGTRVGGAVVSAEHGNFIVNEGGATACDVLALIEILRAKAKAERGVELQTEVEIIGDEAKA